MKEFGTPGGFPGAPLRSANGRVDVFESKGCKSKGLFTLSISVSAAMMLMIIIVIKNNAVTPKWVTTPFRSDTIVFNENRIASVIAELLKRCADAWCKQALIDVEGLGLK